MKEYLKKHFSLSEQGSKNLVKASVYSLITYFINLLPVMILMALVNQMILKNPFENYLYSIISVIIITLMYIVLSKEYISLYNSTYKESANLRIDLAETLADLPISYFSKHDLSDLSQTIMSDVERIEHALSHSIPKVIALYLFVPILGILMLIGNWKLALATIIPTIISFILIPLAKKKSVSGYNKYYNVLRENSEFFQETIELQQEITSFNLSKETKEKLNKKMEESEKIHIKIEKTSILLLGISSLFSYISVAVVILVGIVLLQNKEISLLYLIGYVICALKIKELVDISKEGFIEINYIQPAIERLKELKSTILQKGEADDLKNFEIEFKNVAFSYNKDTPVLKNINFVAKQNEVTALVGPSGCGKTSILRLISRLYDYDKGQILIGGKEIKNIATDSLFKNISIVFQDVTLFNTSILENIRLGREGATDEEVKEAAKLANCMDFIEKSPEGFNTIIGENGAELSGGERQRLSIARAFLKNAPILILDEIAASLDVDNERKIQESINKLIKDKTVIIISHRLKSIENVDKIVLINDGNIESIGTHKELSDKSKIYKNLINKTKLAEEFNY